MGNSIQSFVCQFNKTEDTLDKILVTGTKNMAQGQKKFICTEYTHNIPDDIPHQSNWSQTESGIFFDVDDTTVDARKSLVAHLNQTSVPEPVFEKFSFRRNQKVMHSTPFAPAFDSVFKKL